MEKMSLKTFSNRCRCCLEKFYHDEEINTITNFFKSQYFSFTRMTLQDSPLLAQHVCEFCHTELLRFSGFKKDLIEKQQKLNDLLKQHNEKNLKIGNNNGNTNHSKEVYEISDDGEIKSEIMEPVEQEENISEDDMSESSAIASDDEKDQDFIIVRANERIKAKPKIKKTPPIKKPKIEPKSCPTMMSSPAPLLSMFTCDYCLQTFKAKQGLSRHVQSHIELSIPWKCDEDDCKFAASSKIKLNLHKFNIHGIDQPLPKLSSNPPSPAIKVEKKIKKEKIKEEIKGSHTCFCGASFLTKLSLRAHKNRMHGGINKCNYGCENVQYVKTGHWIRHIQNRHPEKLEEFLKKTGLPTSPAGKSSSSIGATLSLIHCDQCNFKALKKSSMKSHLESHLPDFVRQKFECEICKKMYTRASSLRVHRETVHLLLRKFRCPKCPDMSFKQAGHLSDHIASQHGKNRKKSFRCGYCSKTFMQRYMMNRHLRAVHKVDPRQQPLVPMLSRAIKTKKVPAGTKFRCFCGKEFPFQSRLIKHQLKHEEGDDKMFPCQFAGCAHSFTARCNLIRHQKQKGHLPANELKKLKFGCSCGQRFYTWRGYSYHCDKSANCKKKKKTTNFTAAEGV